MSHSNYQILLAFKYYDSDNNGYITVDELKTALSQNNDNHDYTNDEINSMIKSTDLNGDGKISIEEFIELMK
jgi:Ca2+-binding EF-hand superfamily protein